MTIVTCFAHVHIRLTHADNTANSHTYTTQILPNSKVAGALWIEEILYPLTVYFHVAHLGVWSGMVT